MPPEAPIPGLSRRQRLLWTVGLLILPISILLLYIIENARGVRAWEHYKQQQVESKKITDDPFIDLQNFLQKPFQISDDQNAAKSPLFTRYLDPTTKDETPSLDLPSPDTTPKSAYQPSSSLGRPPALEPIRKAFAASSKLPHPPAEAKVSAEDEILLGLSLFKKELEELKQAADKPHFHLSPVSDDDFGTFPRLSSPDLLLQFSHLLSLRAWVHIRQHESEQALTDTLLLLRLTEWARGPGMLSLYAENSAFNAALQTAWFGLASRTWNPSQLTRLQEHLSRFDLGKDATNSLRSEKLLQIISMNRVADGHSRIIGPYSSINPGKLLALNALPRGWVLQAIIHELHTLDSITASWETGITPTGALTVLPPDDLSKTSADIHGSHFGFSLSNLLRSDSYPTYHNALQLTRKAATQLAFTKAAIAIETHRFEHNALPASLPDNVPPDPATDKPLQYQILDQSRYTLTAGSNTDSDAHDDGSAWLSYIIEPPPDQPTARE